MDQRKKHRKVLRASFTKVANEFEHSLSNPEAERRLIQVSLNILQQKLENLKQVDREIYDELLEADASEEDLLADIEGSDHYERKYNTLSVRCDEILRPQAVEVRSVFSGSGNDHIVQGKRKFKLPVLEFKKYDGTIKDWLPFWSQFKKIHDDPDLDLSDKVEYLIQATVPGSRARQLVESFPATGSNYSNILDCLKARFGRDDLQIEVYVRELLKLIINNATSNDRIELSLLYDRIETQLRALETLGITSDKYAAMLFPLIESCFPPDLLRIWQRAPCIDITEGSGESSLENRLKSLMLFLKNEVENEQHISLAVEGFGLGPNKFNRDIGKNNKYMNNNKNVRSSSIPTATGLANNTSEPRCVFCNHNSHESATCFRAQKLSNDEKRKTLGDVGACFRCLKIGHISRKCRTRVRCIVCSKPHVEIMCPGILEKEPQISESAPDNNGNDLNAGANQALTNSTNTQVFLQTLRIQLDGIGCSKVVRALIDTGSQKSYILASTASSLGYASKRKIDLVHGLFGGSQILRQHNCYDIHLRHNNYACSFEALDQEVICTPVSPVFDGIWSREIRHLGIALSDTLDETPIEVLIGSDVAGRLYTGRRHVLPCGLVAMETFLGWTLMGKIPQEKSSVGNVTALSLFVNDASLANSESRCEVCLPWLEDHPSLPSSYNIAKKRQDNTEKKLQMEGLFETYDQIFKECLDEDIIEEVPDAGTSGAFDLRWWEYTNQVRLKESSEGTSVLGMTWDTTEDTLSISFELENPDKMLSRPVTRKFMLSIGWDTPIDKEMANNFRSGIKDLPILLDIKNPRWMGAGLEDVKQWSINTFCDASKSDANPGVIKSRVSDEKVVVTRSGREVKSPNRCGV